MNQSNYFGQLRSLSAVFGESLRFHRERRGLRQDEVAALARRWGFDWTQATVAAYEIGRRDFSIEELPVLGYIAAHLAPVDAERDDAKPIELADLLPNAGEHVKLNKRVVIDASSLKPILRGEAQRLRLPIMTAPAGRPHGDLEAMSYATMSENSAVLAHLNKLGRAELETAHLDKLGDAEQKAARRLHTFPLMVAATARSLWGRSFTEERDRRVAEQTPPDATPRTLQALRGHVARTLLEELRQKGGAGGIEGLKTRKAVPAPAPPGKKPKRARRR